MKELTLKDFYKEVYQDRVLTVKTEMMQDLATFYQGREQECYNILINDDEELAEGEELLKDRLKVNKDGYTKYGIHISLNDNSIISVEQPMPIFFAESMDDFEEIPHGADCVVLWPSSNDELLILKEHFNIWNNVEIVREVAVEEVPTMFTEVDITNRVATCKDITRDPSDNANRWLDFAETLKSEAKSNCFYTCSTDVGEKEFSNYRNVAAYLAINDVKVHFPSVVYNNVFIGTLQGVMARENLFLDDYLHKIFCPPNVLFNPANNVGEIYIINNYNDIMNNVLKIYEVEVDSSWSKLTETSGRFRMAYYNELDIKPAIELFSLNHGSVNDTGYELLQQVLYNFTKILNKDAGISDAAHLQFSNVLFYTINGKNYVGFIDKIDIKYSCVVIPLCPQYSLYHRTIDLVEFDTLISMKHLYDAHNNLLNLCHKLVKDIKDDFDYPEYSRGVILANISTNGGLFSDSCKFNFVEIGVWSKAASEARGSGANELLKVFRKDILVEKNLLTFWGGPHPSLTNDFDIDSSFWRDNIDD